MSEEDEPDDWFEQALSESEEGDDDADESETPPSEATGSDDPADESDDVAGEPEVEETAQSGVRQVSETDRDDASADEESSDLDLAAGFGGADDGEPGGDEDVFGEDFATAFQNAPAPGQQTGFDGIDQSSGGFDEEFDSDIPRIDIGIEGLDEMIQGGVPERSLMVTIGNAGTGKTTFGLQFLHHALENGENAVFIALEESHDRVVSTADDKGWEFSEYIDRDKLAILDLDPIEMANSLTSVRSELPGLIREFGATRLVLDSVSLLEMMYDTQAIRRNEIYDFTQSLKRAGVTTMLTSEAGEQNPYNSRFGIIEYLTDAVFVLQYIRPEDFRETRLAVEIQKIRDANHSREMKPYEITNDGISVYRQANIF